MMDLEFRSETKRSKTALESEKVKNLETCNRTVTVFRDHVNAQTIYLKEEVSSFSHVEMLVCRYKVDG